MENKSDRLGVFADQYERIEKWWHEHRCSTRYAGAIAGALTYTITPTSIGTFVRGTCQFPDCKEEYDVSDMELW